MTPLRERLRANAFSGDSDRSTSTDMQSAADVLDALVALRPFATEAFQIDGQIESPSCACPSCALKSRLLALIQTVER